MLAMSSPLPVFAGPRGGFASESGPGACCGWRPWRCSLSVGRAEVLEGLIRSSPSPICSISGDVIVAADNGCDIVSDRDNVYPSYVADAVLARLAYSLGEVW